MTDSPSLWRTPVARGPVRGTVTVPGSKSITNRALLLSALSDAPSTVRNALAARDSELMVQGLRTLGHEIVWSNDVITVNPQRDAHVGAVSINCGQAGTVMRFLPGAAALSHGDITFNADASARTRPMQPILAALRALGIEVDSITHLPFTMHAFGRIGGGDVTLDASASSQFVSGLLLSAAHADTTVRVIHRNDAGLGVPSLPHIDMTRRMLASHGVLVDDDQLGDSRIWTVAPQSMKAHDWWIEPDASNALPFIAAAAVTAGDITIEGLGESRLQPIHDVVDVLTQFGCHITTSEHGLHVRGPNRLQGVDVNLTAIAETAVTFAAVCAHATSTSRLRGVAHIRGHETDRIAAIIKVLTSVGCAADYDESTDTLTISPKPLQATTLDSFDDHRMATAGAILGLTVPGMLISDVHVTAKTMPDFVSLWHGLVTGESV